MYFAFLLIVSTTSFPLSSLIDFNPWTFSITNTSGLIIFTILKNCFTKKFLGSFGFLLPAIENPWQGGPPIIKFIFLFPIFLVISFFEIFEISLERVSLSG